jgi:hypothetical protein
MRLIVLATIEVHADDTAAAVALAKEMARATQAEAGCIQYAAKPVNQVHPSHMHLAVDTMARCVHLIDFKINFYETWITTGVEPKAASPGQMVQRDGSPIIMTLPPQRLTNKR